MVFTGRVFEIIEITPNVAQVAFKKKDGDKFVIWVVYLFGFWKEKAIKEMGLKPRMKIKGNLHQNAKKKEYKSIERYQGELYFREIYILEEAPVNMNDRSPNLFNRDGVVDEETGEILT